MLCCNELHLLARVFNSGVSTISKLRAEWSRLCIHRYSHKWVMILRILFFVFNNIIYFFLLNYRQGLVETTQNAPSACKTRQISAPPHRIFLIY